MVRHLGQAEELAQDALVAALEQWPGSGVPSNPGAWLMSTAKRRAIDMLRRKDNLDRKHQEIGHTQSVETDAADSGLAPDEVRDDMLRLIFTTCHPVLSAESRVALTLKLVGGLTTPEIARAYLVGESTRAPPVLRGGESVGRSG